jgi:hypothetical protein
MPPPAPGPLGLADVLAYRDLVARLLRLHDPGAAAKALAAVLTVATTAALAAALRPAQEWCLGGGGGSGGTFLQRAACLPVTTGLVSLPGGAGDVVTVLALVAVANWLLMAGAELADAYLRCAGLADGGGGWQGVLMGVRVAKGSVAGSVSGRA